MKALFFTLKTFAFTLIFIAILQASWKEKTLEERLWFWLHESHITSTFRHFELDGLWKKLSGFTTRQKKETKTFVKEKKVEIKKKWETYWNDSHSKDSEKSP